MLLRRKCLIDRNLLQKACDISSDWDSTSRLICLLDVCSKEKIQLHFDTPLKVRSERVLDILKRFDIPQSNILVEWTEKMIQSILLNKSENHDFDEVVLRKFCNTVSAIRGDGHVKDEYTGVNWQLQDLLFACILFGKVKETMAIISCNKELLNSKKKDGGETPILYAAKMEKREIVLLLAKEGPDISIASDHGEYLRDFIQDFEDIIQVFMKVVIFFIYK